MTPLRLLLVEDDDAYARLLETELASAELHIDRVVSLAQAREHLEDRRVDAVVLDLNLPDSDGLQTVETMHRLAGDTAIVVLTSTASEELALRAVQHGAQDYLLKDEANGPLLLRAVRYARERAAVRQSMRDSEARFRALIEHGYDVITLVDEKGQILFDSRSVTRVMGFAPEERLGKTIEEYLHPNDLVATREQYKYCLAHPDEVIHVEYRFLHKNGNWKWGEAIGVNRLADPAVQAIVVNHRDISERRAVEQALQQSEDRLRQAQRMEAVGRLAGGIAHDFNNVLTAIFGYADLLVDQFSPGDRRRGDIVEIRRAAERAAALTRQLLAFSRKQVMQPRILNLNTVIASVEKLLGRLLGEDVQLALDLDPSLVPVRADPGQIEQVLMNLAANSRDAMPQGGQFRIRTRNEEVVAPGPQRPDLKPGTYAVITVHDTGSGVPPTIRQHIFEPFFTTKELGKGTGFGLATVYGIVQQSGGNVYLDSEDGQGTTFVVYLPRTSAVATSSA